MAAVCPPASAATGARLFDLGTGIGPGPGMFCLVDPALFRSVPVAGRAGKTVLDTRGLWPDQPRAVPAPAPVLRMAG